jgi:N4-gp56 family major capsid protein
MAQAIRKMQLQLMAINEFIPTLWSAELLVSLKKSLVYGQAGVVNRDYQGTISGFGDTVKINGISPVTIGNYAKNTDMAAPETLTGNQNILTIDQAKYFNFQIDDVDKAQQNPKVMNQAMIEAAYALRNTADQFVAGRMATGAGAGSLIGNDTTAVVPTKATAYDYLVDLGVKLDEQDVPEEGRWIILPPWFHGLMEKDSRFIQATAKGDDVIANGVIGRAAGFTVMKSNNVPNTAGAKYKIIAGHQLAFSYAEQVNDVEAFRPESRFADAVKGLHLYGGKVVRPEGIAVMTASKA